MLGYERPRALHGSSRSGVRGRRLEKDFHLASRAPCAYTQSPPFLNPRGTCGSYLLFGRSPEGQAKSPQRELMVLARRARIGRAKNYGFGSEKTFVTPHAWGRRGWQAKMRCRRYCVSLIESIQCLPDVGSTSNVRSN